MRHYNNGWLRLASDCGWCKNKKAVVTTVVSACVRLKRRVSGSQSTLSQKLVHRSTERLGGYGRGAIEGAHDSTIYLRGRALDRSVGRAGPERDGA